MLAVELFDMAGALRGAQSPGQALRPMQCFMLKGCVEHGWAPLRLSPPLGCHVLQFALSPGPQLKPGWPGRLRGLSHWHICASWKCQLISLALPALLPPGLRIAENEATVWRFQLEKNPKSRRPQKADGGLSHHMSSIENSSMFFSKASSGTLAPAQAPYFLPGQNSHSPFPFISQSLRTGSSFQTGQCPAAITSSHC